MPLDKRDEEEEKEEEGKKKEMSGEWERTHFSLSFILLLFEHFAISELQKLTIALRLHFNCKYNDEIISFDKMD